MELSRTSLFWVETFHFSGTARENCTEHRCATAQKLETPAMGVVEKPEADLPRFDQFPTGIYTLDVTCGPESYSGELSDCLSNATNGCLDYGSVKRMLHVFFNNCYEDNAVVNAGQMKTDARLKRVANCRRANPSGKGYSSISLR